MVKTNLVLSVASTCSLKTTIISNVRMVSVIFSAMYKHTKTYLWFSFSFPFILKIKIKTHVLAEKAKIFLTL